MEQTRGATTTTKEAVKIPTKPAQTKSATQPPSSPSKR